MNFDELIRRALEALKANDYLTVDELQAQCEVEILERMYKLGGSSTQSPNE